MVSYITPSLFVLLSAILFVYYTSVSPQQGKILVIGILSAPENFERRATIRDTWIQYIGKDVVHYFLIGKQMCLIPKEDRRDELSCKESEIFLPEGNGSNKSLQSGILTCYNESNEVPIYPGYTFTVQQDIIIHRIGILSKLCTQTVRVSLVEAATDSKITSATFFNEETINSSRIIWKNVEQYRLPKGFEGRIVLESNAYPRNSWQNSCGFNWKSSGNILTYHLLWPSEGQPINHHKTSLASVAISFELADVDNLRTLLGQKSQRKKQWIGKVAMIYQKLNEESNEKKDILFLNVVDSYRSLPQKMLQFYKWVDRNMDFSYLLKTDDDTFINIPQVLKELHLQSGNNKNLPNSIWWWSAFRQGWPVQLFGKWREGSYHSVTYPPFPCGAGYVLSRGAIKFLGKTADELYTEFQGEDAALGIWLAGTNPQSTSNQTSCLWTCDATSHNSCNHPQLSIEQMLEIYKQIKDKN